MPGRSLVDVAHAIVVGVRVAEVGNAVVVGVDGRGLEQRIACFLRVAVPVRIAVQIRPIEQSIHVGVELALVAVQDRVVVAVGILEVDDSIAVGVHTRTAVHELDGVARAVVVVVGVGEVRQPIAIGVHRRLLRVGDPVVVAVLVPEVGNAVAVGIARRRPEHVVARLGAVGNPIPIGVVVLEVGHAIAVGIDARSGTFVVVGDAIAIGVAQQRFGIVCPSIAGWAPSPTRFTRNEKSQDVQQAAHDGEDKESRTFRHGWVSDRSLHRLRASKVAQAQVVYTCDSERLAHGASVRRSWISKP